VPRVALDLAADLLALHHNAKRHNRKDLGLGDSLGNNDYQKIYALPGFAISSNIPRAAKKPSF